MNEEKVKEFESRLESLIAEYGITCAAFTGTCDDHFIGFAVPAQTILSLWQTVLNVGRLWQLFRELIRGKLNEFEKQWE